MAARGRPTQYKKEFAPLAFWMSKAGQTDSEIAEHFGVAPSTICAWKKKFPEFRKALKDGHQCPDRQVEQALFDRAIGYEYEEVDVIVDEDGETKTKTMTRQKAPDVTAQIFWLKNRLPDKWRDKHEFEGKIDGPLVIQRNAKDG